MAEFNEENVNPMDENERRAELEREIGEKCKTLWEKLLELINAWKGRNAYKALEQIKENLETISQNNEATAEAMERTAEVLEELINTTSQLGSRINNMSEAELEAELDKIDKEIDALKNSDTEMTMEEKSVSQALNEFNGLINFNECELYYSTTYNSLYLHNKEKDNYIELIAREGGITFQPHDTEQESINRLKLEPIPLSEDETLDNLTKLRYAIMENLYEDWNEPNKYTEEQKSALNDLEKKRAEKAQLLETVNKFKDGIEVDNFKGVMQNDGTFCLEHKDKNAMIKFFKKEDKIMAYMYKNYDKNTLQTSSKGVFVGKWENDTNGQIKSDLNFDRQYVVRDIMRSAVAEQYFGLYGLQAEDIKTMLKEEAVKNFKKVENEELIAKYIQATADMNKALPEGYSARLIQDNATFIAVLSPQKNVTYINFKENGNVNQYAYKYKDETEPKTVSESGVTVIRENRANQEDYKVSIKAYEECIKALEKESKEQNKEKQKEEQKKSKSQERE